MGELICRPVYNELSAEEKDRYSRQIGLPMMGEGGQIDLKNARVLVVGSGGLGSPCIYYLAAAGIGTIGIVDMDVVDLSNLNRQILHSTSAVGFQKVVSAESTVRRYNPNVEIEAIDCKLTKDNAIDIVSRYDIVVDATDNYAAKFLINDACFFAKRPFIHAGIKGTSGQIMTVFPGESACYRCLFRAGMVTKRGGVLGAVAGMIGCLQAIEVIKYIRYESKMLNNRMIIFDGLEMTFREVSISRNHNCAICGSEPTITEMIDEAD